MCPQYISLAKMAVAILAQGSAPDPSKIELLRTFATFAFRSFLTFAAMAEPFDFELLDSAEDFVILGPDPMEQEVAARIHRRCQAAANAPWIRETTRESRQVPLALILGFRQRVPLKLVPWMGVTIREPWQVLHALIPSLPRMCPCAGLRGFVAAGQAAAAGAFLDFADESGH